MTSITNTLVTKKVAAVAIAVTLAFGMLFAAATPQAHAQLTESQIQSIISLLQSFGADATTINNVDASLRGQTPSGGGSTGGDTGVSTGFTFTQNLEVGATGNEVMELQKFLNSDSATQLAASGAGSPGNETNYFGGITRAGVIKFQNKYSADVLAPVGLSAGTGYWGPSSRAKANALIAAGGSGSTGGDTGGDTGGSTTGGLTVTSVSQPADSLAPDNASRVPFTRFRVTAGNTNVTLSSVTVERVGLGSNAAFEGLHLQDENGVLLGNEKTLNSNNQARLGESVVIAANTSKTFTVVGNMPTDNSTRDGEKLTLRVVSLDSNTTVSGSLPITGATHTVNASLSIGTATMARGSLDPNTNSTKEVGTTGTTFGSVQLTAGSAEDVRVKSIRWDQIGSASADDLENVVVRVDGTEYPTMLGADGDKYTAVFPGSGILVEEGKNVQMSIRGDIVAGSDRTIRFDIEEATDLHVVGETFGFGVTPTAGTTEASASNNSSQFVTGGSPFFSGSQVTVSAGALTITSTNDVPAGNIANGADDVSLGSFKFDVRGEGVTWSSIKFTIATTGSATDGEITSVTLVDGNGNVLAGPEDMNVNTGLVTLSDSVTLPAGENTLIVRGTLDDDWTDNDTIIVRLTPTSSNISSLKGETTGQTITATPSSQVSGKTQTVSAGAFTVTPSGSLTSQTVIGNSSQVTLGRFVLDATNSGEDIRVTVAQIQADTAGGLDVDSLNTLRLYDGSTVLNSGSNEVNPSGNSPDGDPTLSFTMDNSGFVVAKGTSKVIDLKANVATTGGNIHFDVASLAWTVTGVTTGNDISESLSSTDGATMTFSDNGTLTASLDSSDPAERWYVPTEEATLAVIDLNAGNEDMRLTDLGLVLNQASSSPSSLTEISLWNGSTKVFTKTSPTFSGVDAGENFQNLASQFTFDVSANESKDLTVKGKFAGIGTNKPGASGRLFAMGTTTDQTKNKARGLDSGASTNILGSVGTSTGARVFRALPVVAANNSGISTTLTNGSNRDLYRFSVTAKGDDVAIYKTTFNVATTGATVTSIRLRQDDGSQAGQIVASGLQADSNGDVEAVVTSATYNGLDVITIPSGQTVNFTVQGTVAGAGTSGDAVTVELQGDEAFFDNAATLGLSATNADADGNNDFIWSPQSTAAATTGAADWFNGFRVPGIEFSDLDGHTRSN